jgi:hypothetical protein
MGRRGALRWGAWESEFIESCFVLLWLCVLCLVLVFMCVFECMPVDGAVMLCGLMVDECDFACVFPSFSVSAFV